MEDLQRKARLLENEIDMRLISLNKFHISNAGLLNYFFEITL